MTTTKELADSDLQRLLAVAEGEANSVCDGPVGRILARDSPYKLQLLHGAVKASCLLGASRATQFAMAELAAVGSETARPIVAYGFNAIPKDDPARLAYTRCPGLSSVDSVCTLCGRKLEEHPWLFTGAAAAAAAAAIAAGQTIELTLSDGTTESLTPTADPETDGGCGVG